MGKIIINKKSSDMHSELISIFSVAILIQTGGGEKIFQSEGEDFTDIGDAVNFGRELQQDGSDVWIIPMFKLKA
jgi:hypothetical protein